MHNISIIDEIRHYRERHAHSLGFDLDRIVADTKQSEQKLREQGWNLVKQKAQRRWPIQVKEASNTEAQRASEDRREKETE